MGRLMLLYFLLTYTNFVSAVRRDQNPKNIIIDTLNKRLNISRNLKTIGDIKKCLSEEHGYCNHELVSDNKLLKDEEVYSKDKHNDLKMLMKIRGGLNIKVETMQGKKIQLQVSQNETVLDLKKKLEDQQTIPVDQQRLIYNGKLLENNKTISEYGIKDDAVLHLVLRLRGG